MVTALTALGNMKEAENKHRNGLTIYGGIVKLSDGTLIIVQYEQFRRKEECFAALIESVLRMGYTAPTFRHTSNASGKCIVE